MVEEWVFESRQVQEMFSFKKRPNRLRGTRNLPYNPYTGALFSGVKWSGRNIVQLLPSSAEFKNAWNYNCTSPYTSMG